MEKIVDVITYLFLCVFVLSLINSKNKYSFYISCFLFLIASSFRAIGSDMDAYLNIFENIDVVYVEPIFYFIISKLKGSGLGFRFFIIISTAIPLAIHFYIIKDLKNRMLCLFVFIVYSYLWNQASIIRGFFASTFIMLSFFFLSKKNVFLSGFSMVTACLSHFSSLVVFISIFLKSFSSKKVFIAYVPVFFLFGLFFSNFFELVYEAYLVNMDIYVINKLFYYAYLRESLKGVYHNIGHEIIITGINLLSYVISLIITYLFFDSATNAGFYKKIHKFQSVGLLLATFFIGAGAFDIGLRILFLASPAIYILWANILSESTNKLNSFLLSLCFLVIFNLFLMGYFTAVYDKASPFYLG
ncbi:TPA: EpsG family protein [Aeromonas veronii]